jgi:hypothetical protein
MDRIQRMLTGMGGGGQGGGPPGDTPQVDTAEQIYISSLALLKMLKHGARALVGWGWGGVCCMVRTPRNSTDTSSSTRLS